MAPTICLSESLGSRSSVNPYSRRRQRIQNGGIAKQQRLELKRVDVSPSGTAPLTPPDSPLWEPACPSDLSPPIIDSSFVPQISARVPTDAEERWRIIFAQRQGLVDIVVRTMALVRRNNILQERVNALRAQTREFIRSVLSNPENKYHQQQLEGGKEDVVSSTTENIVARPFLPPTPDSTSSSSSSSSDDVTSTCCSSDWENDESASSSSDES